MRCQVFFPNSFFTKVFFCDFKNFSVSFVFFFRVSFLFFKKFPSYSFQNSLLFLSEFSSSFFQSFFSHLKLEKNDIIKRNKSVSLVIGGTGKLSFITLCKTVGTNKYTTNYVLFKYKLF